MPRTGKSENITNNLRVVTRTLIVNNVKQKC